MTTKGRTLGKKHVGGSSKKNREKQKGTRKKGERRGAIIGPGVIIYHNQWRKKKER